MRLIPRCYNGNKILDDTIDKISTGLHLSHEAYTHDKKINKVDNAVSNNLSQQNDDTNYQNSDTSRTVKISPKASVTVGTPYISQYGNNRVRISVNPMDNTAVYNDGDNTYGNVNFAHSKENPELSYVTDSNGNKIATMATNELENLNLGIPSYDNYKREYSNREVESELNKGYNLALQGMMLLAAPIALSSEGLNGLLSVVDTANNINYFKGGNFGHWITNGSLNKNNIGSDIYRLSQTIPGVGKGLKYGDELVHVSKYFPKAVELGSRFGRTIQSGINTAKRFSGWNRAVNNTVRGLSSNPLGKYLLNHRNTAYELGKDAYINQLSNPVQ